MYSQNGRFSEENITNLQTTLNNFLFLYYKNVSYEILKSRECYVGAQSPEVPTQLFSVMILLSNL